MNNIEANPGRSSSPSVDPAELEKFAAMADEWWDPTGKFKPLHALTPVRLGFICDEAARHFDLEMNADRPLADLRVLDIGCGGGLLTEPMARLGGAATGLDAGSKTIEAARIHAEGMGLAIDYRVGTAEEMVAEGKVYDLILNMEVVEHVADINTFMSACADLLAPSGLMIVSTINRTAKAFGLAVVGAEYVLRWLPRGTHDWRKFVKPSELVRALRSQAIQNKTLAGISFNPMTGAWSLDPTDLSVNYLGSFARAG
jgi:2-polyprenyl-6-hydroxyphenyl methylase/3-demethylubiquinone-9 3-methyltransferase